MHRKEYIFEKQLTAGPSHLGHRGFIKTMTSLPLWNHEEGDQEGVKFLVPSLEGQLP